MSALSGASIKSGLFDSTDGTRLFYEVYEPATSPFACVVILPGYDDHAGRYNQLGQHLAKGGVRAVTFDYRGHGRASGRRGHCRRFEEYLSDLDSALAFSVRIGSHVPLVLLGQSHGGLIALRWLCEPTRLGSVDAAVFASPYLGPAFHLSWYELLALGATSRVLPTLTLGNRLQADDLTHDDEKVAARKSDPLLHGVATVRWCTESRRAQREVADRVDQVRVPTLWLIAGADRIADSSVSLQQYERLQAAKELHLYEGLYHELFNELGSDRVIADLMTWLRTRYPVP